MSLDCSQTILDFGFWILDSGLNPIHKGRVPEPKIIQNPKSKIQNCHGQQFLSRFLKPLQHPINSPNRHRPQVMTRSKRSHRRNRLRCPKLQAILIDLSHDRLGQPHRLIL
jgi:hypothetical protein